MRRVATTAVLVLLAAGCAGDDRDAAPASTTTAPAVATTAAEPPTSTPASGGAAPPAGAAGLSITRFSAGAVRDWAATIAPMRLGRVTAQGGRTEIVVGVTTGLTGGIEFPTHIFLGSGVATIHLVHEVAHQWFYGLVGNDQFRDPWLDEGFATYGQSRVDGALAYQRSRAIPAAGRGRLGETMGYWCAVTAQTGVDPTPILGPLGVR